MYKVIKRFFDLKTQVCYSVGDIFPHDGASAERIEELASDKNRLGVPLIEEIVEKPKRTNKKRTDKIPTDKNLTNETEE